jgi:hypothetical protein
MHVSDPLMPDFIQLYLFIVNSASRGCIDGRNWKSCTKAK